MMRKKEVPGKPDHTDIGRRKILKGVGAASAATALSVPMILVPPSAYAATELNMFACYCHV